MVGDDHQIGRQAIRLVERGDDDGQTVHRISRTAQRAAEREVDAQQRLRQGKHQHERIQGLDDQGVIGKESRQRQPPEPPPPPWPPSLSPIHGGPLAHSAPPPAPPPW